MLARLQLLMVPEVVAHGALADSKAGAAAIVPPSKGWAVKQQVLRQSPSDMVSRL